jgi:hypothetical protein
MTIRPFENARERTSRVHSALEELGALPSRPSQRPSFLRAARVSERLLNRALAAVGRGPIILTGKDRVDAMTLNEALAPIASGMFTNISSANAADGIYTLNGNPAALGDIIDLSFPDGNFDPGLDLDSNGIMPRPTGGGGSRETTLYLKAPLVASILDGYTAVFSANFASTDQGGFTATVLHAACFDYPNYTTQPEVVSQWKENDVPPGVVKMFSAIGNETDFGGEISSSGIHKIAITATAEKIVASVDGGPTFSVAEPGIDQVCNGFYFNIGGDLASRLRSFEFYEPVDDADLPALSALS